MKPYKYTRMIGIYVEADTDNKVREITDRLEVGKSEWVRNLIIKEIERMDKENEQRNQ